MKNKYFQDEEITKDDLFFICYMIERTARKIHQRNRYVVNQIGAEALYHLLSVANVLHCENPLVVEEEWVDTYGLKNGTFDIADVDPELCEKIPSATSMGKVYARLIQDTLEPNENDVNAIIRVYNNPICNIIDNYNCSAYYEPSYYIAKAYNDGGF